MERISNVGIEHTYSPASLAADIRAWWSDECADWDAAVETGENAAGSTDLWDDMPTVDSKAVARMSPIFKRHLGIPLDVKIIRPGGYNSIDDAIEHLVPEMESRAIKSRE